MKADKIPNMVATIPKRRPGRPRRYMPGSERVLVTVSPRLLVAAERMREELQRAKAGDGLLVTINDALLELARRGAESHTRDDG